MNVYVLAHLRLLNTGRSRFIYPVIQVLKITSIQRLNDRSQMRKMKKFMQTGASSKSFLVVKFTICEVRLSTSASQFQSLDTSVFEQNTETQVSFEDPLFLELLVETTILFQNLANKQHSSDQNSCLNHSLL